MDFFFIIANGFARVIFILRRHIYLTLVDAHLTIKVFNDLSSIIRFFEQENSQQKFTFSHVIISEVKIQE